MRIFVVGTGRCGTVTFSRACRHIKEYTSGHESLTTLPYDPNNRFYPGSLLYPDEHIEVDPRLSASVVRIQNYYGDDCKIFHLIREPISCIESLSKRMSLWQYMNFHFGWFDGDYKNAARMYYNNTVQTLEKLIPPDRTLRLENLSTTDWDRFCNQIEVNPDCISSDFFQRKYNAS